jgi:hypothetical protein
MLPSSGKCFGSIVPLHMSLSSIWQYKEILTYKTSLSKLDLVNKNMAASNQEHPTATGTDEEYTKLTLYMGFINNLIDINQVQLGTLFQV